MNIESSSNKTQAPTTKSDSVELKRSDLSVANSVTATYATGAIVFERTKVSNQGNYVKVSIENDKGWKKQIGMLAEYPNGNVGILEQPTEFRINGVLWKLNEYYKSL